MFSGTGSTTNSAYNEYVFFGGRRIASRNGSGGIFYYFADQLGSTRTITTGSGTGQTPGQLCYDADFTPYGQEIQHTERLQTTACPPNYKFTGYEYDSETGLHYAFARYYSARLGRFLSTDPLGGAIGDLQSHNAYAHTRNNPTNLVDPSGLRGCDKDDPGCNAEMRDAIFALLACHTWCSDDAVQCYANGFASSCGMVSSLLQQGLAGFCPNNDCSKIQTGQNGQFQIYETTPYTNPDCPPATICVGIEGHWVTVNFVIMGGASGGGNSSWAWTFTKTFVSNFFSPSFYKQELSEGGCLAAFGEGFDRADILGAALNGSPGIAETAIKGQAATVAARYAAGKALTVPLRSSVVRGILGAGGAGATYFAPVYLEAQGLYGVINEAHAAATGACH